MAYLTPLLTATRLRQFAITLVLLSSLLFIVRMSTFTFFPRPQSDAFLPNKHIAHSMAKLWHQHYHQPLAYIAGSNYLIALLTPYLNDKPQPYFSWSKQQSPWINEEQLRKKGALFIWDEVAIILGIKTVPN